MTNTERIAIQVCDRHSINPNNPYVFEKIKQEIKLTTKDWIGIAIFSALGMASLILMAIGAFTVYRWLI